jgi:hypothetical protein
MMMLLWNSVKGLKAPVACRARKFGRLKSPAGAVEIFAGEDRSAPAFGLMLDAAIARVAGGADRYAPGHARVLNIRRVLGNIPRGKTFRTREHVTIATGYPISLDEHPACERKATTMFAVNARQTQRAVVQLRFWRQVIDTDIAVPPPTLGRLNEPVILPVPDPHVRPETMPASVPQEHAEFLHRVAVVIR